MGGERSTSPPRSSGLRRILLWVSGSGVSCIHTITQRRLVGPMKDTGLPDGYPPDRPTIHVHEPAATTTSQSMPETSFPPRLSYMVVCV